jgi:hypothetical protein
MYLDPLRTIITTILRSAPNFALKNRYVMRPALPLRPRPPAVGHGHLPSHASHPPNAQKSRTRTTTRTIGGSPETCRALRRRPAELGGEGSMILCSTLLALPKLAGTACLGTQCVPLYLFGCDLRDGRGDLSSHASSSPNGQKSRTRTTTKDETIEAARRPTPAASQRPARD